MQGVVKAYDPASGEGVVVSDTDRREYVLAAGSLEGSVFRMLRQGQRVVFDLDDSGRARSAAHRRRARHGPADRHRLSSRLQGPGTAGPLSAGSALPAAVSVRLGLRRRLSGGRDRPRRRRRGAASDAPTKATKSDRRPNSPIPSLPARLNIIPPSRPPATPTTIVPRQPRRRSARLLAPVTPRASRPATRPTTIQARTPMRRRYPRSREVGHAPTSREAGFGTTRRGGGGALRAARRAVRGVARRRQRSAPR